MARLNSINRAHIRFMRQKLPLHEWLIISLLIAIFFLLIGIAYIRESRSSLPSTDAPQELIDSYIYVTIRGAVVKPGSYALKRGATLKQLVELTPTLPEADLKGLKWHRPLRDGQIIHIPVKSLITIFLEGAVETEGAMQVFKGTRWEDLLTLVRFKAEADLKKLHKKRYLKDQEVIHVPVKKKNQKP